MHGVGRTTNLIYTLPNERCMIIASERGIGKNIENLLTEIRGKDFAKRVKVISISSTDDLNKIMGYSHLVFFDHSFFDSVEEELAKKALDLAVGASIVYHHQKGNFK